MTNHKDLTARSGRATWRLTSKYTHSLLICGFALVGYLALSFVDGPQFAQSASTQSVAYAPAAGYVADSSWEKRLTDEIVTMGSVELLGADSLQFAPSASEAVVAAGPTNGNAGDTSPEQRLAEEHPMQTYTDWLRAAHADAALHGQDAPLPDQF
jgi:hypothetical protein